MRFAANYLPPHLHCHANQLILFDIKPDASVPSYDFFHQCAQFFEVEKRAVPYFNHKQLSYSFEQAQIMVKTANRLGSPCSPAA